MCEKVSIGSKPRSSHIMSKNIIGDISELI